MATLYDIFPGLAVGASIAGQSWDNGAISWSASTVTTQLVGKGSDEVGGPDSPGSFSLGNFVAPNDANGYAVFFRQLAGYDINYNLLAMYVNGVGSASEYPDGNAVRLTLGGYNEFSLTEMATGTTTSDTFVRTSGQDYCAEILRTGDKTYVANLYTVSGGARSASPVKTIGLTTVNTATGQLTQFQTPPASMPYLRMSRFEVITASGGGGTTTIDCGVGGAAAAGLTAAVTNAGTTTISAFVGNAVAAGAQASVDTLASGSFTTEPLINNVGIIWANQPVAWTWYPGGRIGSMDIVTAEDGAGTTGSDGRLQATGLTPGDGVLLVAVLNTDATDDAVYYEAGTVA